MKLLVKWSWRLVVFHLLVAGSLWIEKYVILVVLHVHSHFQHKNIYNDRDILIRAVKAIFLIVSNCCIRVSWFFLAVFDAICFHEISPDTARNVFPKITVIIPDSFYHQLFQNYSGIAYVRTYACVMASDHNQPEPYIPALTKSSWVGHLLASRAWHTQRHARHMHACSR